MTDHAAYKPIDPASPWAVVGRGVSFVAIVAGCAIIFSPPGFTLRGVLEGSGLIVAGVLMLWLVYRPLIGDAFVLGGLALAILGFIVWVVSPHMHWGIARDGFTAMALGGFSFIMGLLAPEGGPPRKWKLSKITISPA